MPATDRSAPSTSSSRLHLSKAAPQRTSSPATRSQRTSYARRSHDTRLDTITRIMPELPLYDHERNALARHLDSVSMSELMRRQPPTHPGSDRGAAQLHTDPGPP